MSQSLKEMMENAMRENVPYEGLLALTDVERAAEGRAEHPWFVRPHTTSDEAGSNDFWPQVLSERAR